MIVRGQGTPLVFIPGIQGRWELLKPAVDALAERHRVLTFSLDQTRTPDCFAEWTTEIARGLDEAGESSAAIVGVSFGGLIAVKFAAAFPERTRALVLASTPRARGIVSSHVDAYLRHPRLSVPLFAFRAIGRLGPELMATRKTWMSRAGAAINYTWRALRWPMDPVRMVAWVRAWPAARVDDACRDVRAPTLVITGDEALNRVVPVADTLEYLTLIANARHETFARHGSPGTVAQTAGVRQTSVRFRQRSFRHAGRHAAGAGNEMMCR